MQRLACLFSIGIAILGIGTTTRPVGAQNQVKTTVPFKGTMKGPIPAYVGITPVDPPIVHVFNVMTGESEMLGKFTYADHHPVQMGVDGKLLGVVNGMGSIKVANGDTLFFWYCGPAYQDGPKAHCEHFFVVNGGTGRFAGAIGSGYLRGGGSLEAAQQEWTIEGQLVMVKA